jgi:hypothetical protein
MTPKRLFFAMMTFLIMIVGYAIFISRNVKFIIVQNNNQYTCNDYSKTFSNFTGIDCVSKSTEKFSRVYLSIINGNITVKRVYVEKKRI